MSKNTSISINKNINFLSILFCFSLDTNSKSDYSKKSPSEEKIVTQQPNQENSEANPIQEPEKMDVDIEQNSTSEKPSTLSE